MKAPPCSHTITGSRAPGAGAGVHTLRFRQSSPGTSGSGSSAAYVGVYGTLGAVGPYAPASRTPSQAAGGAGAAKRSAPTGGAAYGTPRKTAMPPGPVRPSTTPWAVLTRGRPVPPAVLMCPSLLPVPLCPCASSPRFPGTLAQSCDG